MISNPETDLALDELAALAESGPALDVRSITVDLLLAYRAPRVGSYVVTVGASTGAIGSVYRIESVRLVEPREPRQFHRYALEVLPTPALRPHAVASAGRVWVGGVEGLSLRWHPRKKAIVE